MYTAQTNLSNEDEYMYLVLVVVTLTKHIASLNFL